MYKDEIDKYLVGGIDAWTDFERDLLNENFIPIVQYAQVAEREILFLCGRRGAGKSAIAVMMHKTPHWSRHKIFPGERSEYGAYLDLVEDLDNKRTTASLSIDIKKSINLLWRYTLAVIVLNALCENAYELGIRKFGGHLI